MGVYKGRVYVLTLPQYLNVWSWELLKIMRTPKSFVDVGYFTVFRIKTEKLKKKL